MWENCGKERDIELERLRSDEKKRAFEDNENLGRTRKQGQILGTLHTCLPPTIPFV
jgi:hypothetical protein